MDAPQRRLQALSNHFDSLSLGNNQKLESSNCAVSAESEILNIERRRVGVPVEKLTEVFFGGADKVKIYKETYERLGQEPLFSNTLNVADKGHGEIRELTMARIRRLFDLESWKLDNKTINVLGRVIYVIDPSTAVRLGVHTGLFLGSVTGNGTEYHRKKYFKPGTRAKIFGCFGMTELGHGSNAAGLETTATFDKKNQEFIVNSPTLTSTKWWIGGAAETATHCCVFARLIIGEKDYGVHAFIVPLRDIKTHKPLPGVTIGDCGDKMGMNGIDNGYLRFANVRIPREDMLDQYARVEPDGSYWKAGKSALALQRVALIGARCNIVGQSALDGMSALTIAIRYSAIRRQFEDGPGKPERTILDYQTHMHRLFLPLSEIAALQFASLALDESHNTLLEELHTGNTNNLGDVHAIAAGMKAFSSWTTRDILTIARDCLGGHGFSSYNKISRMMKDFQVQTTWDGDNTVLSQQTAKYLVSSLQKAMEGKKLKGSVKFLEDVLTIVQSQCTAKDTNDLRDFTTHQAAFRWRIATLVATCAQKIQASVAEGMDPMSAWNSSLVDLIALAKAHCDLYKLEAFAAAVDKMKNTNEKPKTGHSELVTVLTILRNLYALQIIEKDLGMFRENDYISSDLAKMIKLEVRQLCLELRPYAVFVVDSFAIPDFVLDAPVGCADGNIYERYFERVKQAPGSPVPPYWDKIIRPLTNNPNEITE